MTPLVQCVPNFSEGRDLAMCKRIADAAQGFAGVRVADWSADADHNRMVLTLVGPPEQTAMACAAACAVALRLIDLRTHTGAHPRLGAVDVVPFVPLSGITLPECAALSVEFAQALARRHGLPVFLYEAAVEKDGPPAPITGSSDGQDNFFSSTPPIIGGPGGPALRMARSLPFVRKMAWNGLLPDFGPHAPHHTAGAAVVGARLPLLAYNVNLSDDNLPAAQQIARELRENGGAGFHGVRALGLFLPLRGTVQVSMNITRPAETPLLSVFQYVQTRAAQLGTAVTGSEIIGALPGFAALSVVSDALRAALLPGQILWEGMQNGGEGMRNGGGE